MAGATVDIAVGSATKQLKTGKNARFVLRANPDSMLVVTAVAPDYFRAQLLVSDLRQRIQAGHDTLFFELVLDKIYPNREIVLDDIFYEFNDFVLRPDAGPALEKLAELLRQNPVIRLDIAAHTDCRGNDAYNLRLSEQRAQSVVNYLLAVGIAADRLTAIGYGKTRPATACVCAACTEQEHQKNRRTMFAVRGPR